MTSLAREGFANLIEAVATIARECSSAEEAINVCLTMNGRTPREFSVAALAPADQETCLMLARSNAGLDAAGKTGTVLRLTRTGRLRFTTGTDDTDDHLIGSIKWSNGEPPDLTVRRRTATAEAGDAWRQLHDGLLKESEEECRARLDAIAVVVVHMAPVLLYVGDRTYGNLGRWSNLPGKSFRLGQPGCLLSSLAQTPVARWRPEDASFVACVGALLASGPPVRIEEFNGVQIGPEQLEQFLRERLADYGAPVPDRAGASLLAWLDRLARACADARAAALRAGAVAYRLIHGLNLHKRERLMHTPLSPADVPDSLLAVVADRAGSDPAGASSFAGWVPVAEQLADRLAAAPAPAGFTSALAEFLHHFLTATAEAYAADVAMSRGPRSYEPLRGELAPDTADPLTLRTMDFYCCVTPRAKFAEQFGSDRAQLVQVLSAYSARMRYNTWHYLPHTLTITERGEINSKRSDWFFAPTMPDLTDWSDQHHTGHINFGVRHAIRVPFGVTVDNRPLPGLYDLRLLRTTVPPFDMEDLRSATATGLLLRLVYQAMVRHFPSISDFDNGWFRAHYG